jgi:hypothetical protein
VRFIESRKGSAFVMCEYSKIDPRFAKYPRLPVMTCKAFAENKTDAKPK